MGLSEKFSIGEIKRGKEIGKGRRLHKFIRSACEECGKERWVLFIKGEAINKLCRSCSQVGERNGKWKGGYASASGYRLIRLAPNDFFYPMAKKSGYVFEHRLGIARELNRCLFPWEVVHHKNGIRDDNRRENLELLPHGRFHLVDLQTKGYIKALEKRIESLERKVLCGEHTSDIDWG